MAIKSKREAIATYTGMDFYDIEDLRYHQGQTSQPVYAFTDYYLCVARKGQKPAKHRSGMEWEWEEVVDSYVNGYGYKIWKAKSDPL